MWARAAQDINPFNIINAFFLEKSEERVNLN